MPRPSLFFVLESMRATLQDLAATSIRTDRFNQILRWLAVVEKRLQLLEKENQELRREQRTSRTLEALTEPPPLPPVHDFHSVEGVLWRRGVKGFEPLPYCPRCRSILILFPAKTPDVIRCPACRFQPPFGPDELRAVRKLLPA